MSSPDQLDMMQRHADEAAAWVADLASGKRKWQMRIPVDARDSDVVLMQAVMDLERLIEEVRQLHGYDPVRSGATRAVSK